VGDPQVVDAQASLRLGALHPIGVGGICFSESGELLGTIAGYAEQDELAAGAIGSFSIEFYGDPCPIGLLAASGYSF
jgi:hypothetical protein